VVWCGADGWDFCGVVFAMLCLCWLAAGAAGTAVTICILWAYALCGRMRRCHPAVHAYVPWYDSCCDMVTAVAWCTAVIAHGDPHIRAGGVSVSCCQYLM
jgi:hypothetical protein